MQFRIVLDASTIVRCKEIEENIKIMLFDFLESLGKLYIPPCVSDEIRAKGVKIKSSVEIKDVMADTNTRRVMGVNTNKNMGEADCVEICLKNKTYLFLTDDYLALKNAETLIGDRSLLLIPFLIEYGKGYYTKQELLSILKERHRQRRFRERIYKILERKIKEGEF